jgi:hypothetical protein|tara:strand:+ start:329 stop:733 length:405 start_codon:yes stop_codon:yes gene_type:complete
MKKNFEVLFSKNKIKSKVNYNVSLKTKIKNLLTEIKKLNKLIVQQQKLQKNNDAISTQIKIDNLKEELMKISKKYSITEKTKKKEFFQGFKDHKYSHSSLSDLKGYLPINRQAASITGYKKKNKKGKKNKMKKK